MVQFDCVSTKRDGLTLYSDWLPSATPQALMEWAEDRQLTFTASRQQCPRQEPNLSPQFLYFAKSDDALERTGLSHAASATPAQVYWHDPAANHAPNRETYLRAQTFHDVEGAPDARRIGQ